VIETRQPRAPGEHNEDLNRRSHVRAAPTATPVLAQRTGALIRLDDSAFDPTVAL
jgi:hypothetical protein